MLARSNALPLLKALVAAAWADSTLSLPEFNYIKELARKFKLADSEWLELEPHLEDPISETEREHLFRDLLDRIATPRQRRAALTYLEGIANADSEITPQERELLERYRAILRDASTLELLGIRIKALFGKKDPAAFLDIDEFVRNKVLFKLRRRIGSDRITPEMHRIALLGGLMGIVAQADGAIDERELAEIRRHLDLRGSFNPEELDLMVSIISEESVRGLDRARLIGEYARDADRSRRVELLDLLFAVAAADGALTHRELEQLRGIASALRLPHKRYIEAKLRAREKHP